MPEYIDPKSGKRLYHENETTLEVEKKILSKFAKDEGAPDSYMHRSAAEPQIMDEERRVDSKGKAVGNDSAKLSLYDVEYKLDGMIVVPVNKNTGEPLDDKQVEEMNKQLGRLWMLKEEE